MHITGDKHWVYPIRQYCEACIHLNYFAVLVSDIEEQSAYIRQKESCLILFWVYSTVEVKNKNRNRNVGPGMD